MSKTNDSNKLYTPKELAAEIGCDAKALRAAMRKLADETPGSGGRWGIDEDFANVLRTYMTNKTNRKVVVAKVKNAD